MTVRTPPSFVLTLLGPIEALWGDTPVAVDQNTARALLAYLALESDRPHARELLASLFWPNHAQAAAYNNLRQTLIRLRKSFATPADLDTVLVITPQTLQFNLASADVDVVRFTHLLAETAAHAHLDAARCPACHERFIQAAVLYRGNLLHGLSLEASQPFEEWLLHTRERLHVQALDLLHTLTESAEALGDYTQMRFYANRQLTLEPWREEAHAQVMRALAYSGQPAAALAQYETCRRILEAEFGIEPSPDIVALHQHIRERKLRPTVQEPSEQFEQPLTPFVGRERELEEIIVRLRQPQTRLLTLLGLGGIGKTRLALAAAQALSNAFPDGVFLVSLAPLATATAIVPAIIAALRLNVPTSDLHNALLQTLRNKRLLLILDNVEHLLDGVPIVIELLGAAPYITILTTSRERLNLRAEHVYTVGGMDYTLHATVAEAEATSAVRLFVQSARRVRPDFRITETNLRPILQICQFVRGMPLGLELAASWTELLPPDTIAAEIKRSIGFLAREWRDVPERHHSVRGVFDWSWRRLSDGERQVFRRLSVFRGGFTYEAAQTIAGASPQVLNRLLHTALLSHGETTGEIVRYELHELLRQFAAEHLDTAPEERVAVEARHSAFYLPFVAAREERLLGSETLAATREIRAEIDNVRQAWTSAVETRQWSMIDQAAFSLYHFYQLIGFLAEAEQTFNVAAERLLVELHHVPTNTPEQRTMQSRASKLQALHASALFTVTRFDRSIDVAQQAIALGEASMSCEGEALSQLAAGRVLHFSSQGLAARPHLERARQLAHLAGAAHEFRNLFRDVAWTSELYLALGAMMLGEYEQARQHLDLGMTVCRTFGLLRGEMTLLIGGAHIDRDQGQLIAARHGYDAARRIAHTIGAWWGEGIAENGLGTIARREGKYREADERLGRALHNFRMMGNTLYEASTLQQLGWLHSDIGNLTTAHEWFDQAWSVVRTIKAPNIEADILLGLACLALAQAKADQAVVHAEGSVKIARAIKNRGGEVDALIVLGHARIAMDQSKEAKIVYWQALTLCDGLGRKAPVAEAHAGLASVALQDGDRTAALSHVDVILGIITHHVQIDFVNPFYVYLVCYRVLDAYQDARATPILHTAQHLLHTYASSITDSTLRQSFFEQVPTHRALLVT